MYSAGIEPVTLVTAELRSNCSAIEQTDTHCGKMPIHTTFLEGGGGAKMTLFKRWECVFFANTSPLAIDNKKFNFDVFGRNRTGDLSDGRAAF